MGRPAVVAKEIDSNNRLALQATSETGPLLSFLASTHQRQVVDWSGRSGDLVIECCSETEDVNARFNKCLFEVE
jgi:hypothetical protein